MAHSLGLGTGLGTDAAVQRGGMRHACMMHAPASNCLPKAAARGGGAVSWGPPAASAASQAGMADALN